MVPIGWFRRRRAKPLTAFTVTLGKQGCVSTTTTGSRRVV